MKRIIDLLLLLYFAWTCYQNYNYTYSSSAPVMKQRAKEKASLTQKETELSRQLYIQKYKPIAVREMHCSGIPASITLAQGLLESRYGTSQLAEKAHNHFGIKCGQAWAGDRYCTSTREWDSKTQSMVPHIACFRWYASAEESFRNHSDFLKGKERYAFLFKYGKTNCDAWAKGLQKAGYATDPKYAVKLLSLIQRYELGQYDVDYKVI